jgi:hypothetical protein
MLARPAAIAAVSSLAAIGVVAIILAALAVALIRCNAPREIWRSRILRRVLSCNELKLTILPLARD